MNYGCKLPWLTIQAAAIAAAVLSMAGAIIMATPAPALAAQSSVYQWSVPVIPPAIPNKRPASRAYLWIPPDCKQVRAVVVGQQNMLEEDIFDHHDFRKAMTELGFAIVWIAPSMDAPWNPEQTAPRFNAMMKSLADTSGYSELEFAPIIPIGHSAHATYPWNFAAWAPARTLCALSVSGDAPETPLAGFGKQNVHWPDGVLDGVPGLMIMGEYEWIEARLAPAVVYHSAFPNAPIAVLAEPAEGHFYSSDDQIRFLTMFIRKCAELRLPAATDTPYTAPPTLIPVDPAKDWLVQRWYLHHGRTVKPGPSTRYRGDTVDAFWASDEEMANAIQNYHADQVGKKTQLIGYVQDGKVVPATTTHQMVDLTFEPESDGETFKLSAAFLDRVSSMGADKDATSGNNHQRWTGLPAGTPIGHASGGGPIQFHRTEGPAEQIAPDTFRLSFYRGATPDHPEIWICATHPGDDTYKGIIQQSLMRLPRNTTGTPQSIDFAAIPAQKTGTKSLKLTATSSAGVPVHFYVQDGPAEIDDDTLRFTPIPARAKYPIKVTVVAWQWGRTAEPKVQTAVPVTQEFLIGR